MAILPFFSNGQILYSLEYLKSDSIKPSEYTVISHTITDGVVYYAIKHPRYYQSLSWKEDEVVRRIQNKLFFVDLKEALEAVIKMHENEKNKAKREYDYQVEKHDKKIENIKKQISTLP
jgi:hypothetical protein